MFTQNGREILKSRVTCDPSTANILQVLVIDFIALLFFAYTTRKLLSITQSLIFNGVSTNLHGKSLRISTIDVRFDCFRALRVVPYRGRNGGGGGEYDRTTSSTISFFFLSKTNIYPPAYCVYSTLDVYVSLLSPYRLSHPIPLRCFRVVISTAGSILYKLVVGVSGKFKIKTYSYRIATYTYYLLPHRRIV